MSQLPIECLNEIFEGLDNRALRSCLLVSQFWCKVSIPILWTSIQNCRTLIACLPNESKEMLYKSRIFIPAPTSKPLLFNYVTFIKNVSLKDDLGAKHLGVADYRYGLVLTEIFKMFMSQTCLKKLNLFTSSDTYRLLLTLEQRIV